MKTKLFLIIMLTIIGLSTNAQYTDLYNFDNTHGQYPQGSLSLIGGKLYGMTSQGGTSGYGCIFSMDTNGNNFKDILEFKNLSYPQGEFPYGSLTPSVTEDTLFGMTYMGGANSVGVIFCVDTNGNNYTDLWDFNGTTGSYPGGSLVLSDKILYGMTDYGGATDSGAIFSFNLNGFVYNDLHDFNGIMGCYPQLGHLTLLGTELFGMTHNGGAFSDGIIFSINTNGSGYRDLLDFNGTNGSMPEGSLTPSGSKLFGMADGGTHNNGVIFSIDTNGNGYKDLLDFNITNGAGPAGDVTLSHNMLYGMTSGGGGHSDGIVFSVDTIGHNYSDLLDFNGNTPDQGAGPSGDITISGNILYGMTYRGGLNFGVIFRFKDNSISTSINESFATSGMINVYPNPFTDKFSIENIMEGEWVTLYDLTGREVGKYAATRKVLSIYGEGLQSGIYILKNESGQAVKLVKE